jgi:hypothetical protein
METIETKKGKTLGTGVVGGSRINTINMRKAENMIISQKTVQEKDEITISSIDNLGPL